MQAVDSGRRSGHGRVVYLYYDLCAKIWGGSPATEQIDTGLETEDLNVSSLEPTDTSPSQEDTGIDEELDEDNDESSNQQQNNEENMTSSDPTSSNQTSSSSTSHLSELDSSAGSRIGRKRRADGQTCSVLNSYKQQKLKKKVSADSQILHFAEREIELKERMMERMDTMDKDHRETMNCLISNLKTLTDTMASAFSLLQQSLQRPGPSPYLPYSGLGPASGSGYNYHHFTYSQSPLPNHPRPPPTSPPGVYPPVPGYIPQSQPPTTSPDDYDSSLDLFDNNHT